MLKLRKLRALSLEAPAASGRPAHLAAASGLVKAGKHLYVIGDDEHHLAVFNRHGEAPGRLVRLVPGKLPRRTKKRKAVKPDFEALVLLPPFASYPEGALFAMGSGSRPQREAGVLLGLDAAGAIAGAPRHIDLSDFYRGLRRYLGEINIEGAVVVGGQLRLLNRGNQQAPNILVDVPLAPFAAALVTGVPTRVRLSLTMRTIDLGCAADVPLCFSDAAALEDGGMLFTAIAEITDNSYDDGRCVGSAVGMIRPDASLGWIEPLDGAWKVEGLHVRLKHKTAKLLLVTDADDVRIPAALLGASLPIGMLRQ